MHLRKINLLHAEIMNNFIIVYMESFSAYDPTTKTGELHAFLTIDISLRSFPFHSAWRTMTHDKSLWSMKRSCSFMMNYEPKMKTENRKQKTAKRKMKTFTPSSSLRMPGKHENENRSEHRRESRRDRDERRRSSSSSPEPTPFKAGKPILEPAHQNIGSRGTFGPNSDPSGIEAGITSPLISLRAIRLPSHLELNMNM